MTDWTFAETDPLDELAKLHIFSMQKRVGERKIEFRSSVHEYVTRNELGMKFFAQADRQTNQEGVPFTPFGWGQTLLQALSECVESIHRFPYSDDGES